MKPSDAPPNNTANSSARMITTRTIAHVAEVNVSTVSRALRGVSGVSPAECKRIRAIAKRLGYRPNPYVAAFTAQVRAYRRAPSPALIALLDCWPDERPSWAHFKDNLDYIRGIRDRAEILGYRVEHIRLVDLGGSVERLQRLLTTRHIYGLLVLPVPHNTDLSALNFSRLACATIDFSLQQPSLIRRTSPHYYHNVWLALKTLAERGYKRIGYAETPVTAQGQDNLGLAAFLAFGTRHPQVCVAPCLTEVHTRQHDLTAWVRRERPDAIVTADFLFPDDLTNIGCRVPEDIAAISLSRPPDPARHAAYIDENYREIGAQAIDMIVDAIHRNEFGLPTSRIVHFVDGTWHGGLTVCEPPRLAKHVSQTR